MKSVTIRIIDGANRGEVFDAVAAPITIGREEGNTIQLNDERVSRFHLRIQQDHDDIVLTDLDSTNGSRVNNEEVQLKILRPGDVISIGRSSLLFGARDEIAERLGGLDNEQAGQVAGTANQQIDGANSSRLLAMSNSDTPKIPDRLSPGQAAQLSELLDFFHLHVRQVVGDADISGGGRVIQLDASAWQHVVELQARLAQYLEQIGQPQSPG